MSRCSSTSRSEVRRRDRHKVYAAADLQARGRTGSDASPSSAAKKEGSKGSCSSRAAAPSRGEGERFASTAVSTDGSIGERVDDRNGPHEAPAVATAAAAAANLGSVGPGAEPPVAVASHAFAHEELQTRASHRLETVAQERERASTEASFPVDEGVRVLSSEDDVGTGRSVDRGGNTESSRRCRIGKEDTAGSRPESTNTNTNNEEEAETLPDSFNLSDEYGLEGASTGRYQHDDDDDDNGDAKCKEPVFFGLDVESTSSGNRGKRNRGRGRPADGRYSRTRRGDDDSSSEYEPRQAKGNGRMYISASDSDSWLSSSREGQANHRQASPQQQLWFRRRARRSSRRPSLTATKRNSRIVPSEDAGERRAGRSEGTRRHRGGHTRNSLQYRSPPPRRHPQGTEVETHPRRMSVQKHLDSKRLAQSETESVSAGATNRFEEEMARLRRENKSLRQRRERITR